CRCRRARGGRHRPYGRRRAPGARPRGQRAGAAQPLARRPRAPPGGRAERLGRHLAPHPRLREPRGALAARRRARGDLPGSRLHAHRAPRDLPRFRRPPRLPPPRAARARGRARRGAAGVGAEVTYVVNRNINFTNVSFVNGQFCAFKRQRWEDDAYTHGADVVLGKVEEAIARGATEVCMQGGINPEMGAFTYRDMLVAIKSRFPEIHVHAFSPMEIMYGARRT